jgi:hypothetical protein
MVAIESLKVGDLVLTAKANTFSYEPILKTFEYPPTRVLSISLEGKSRPLLVTPSHTLRVKGKWGLASVVRAGDSLALTGEAATEARVLSVDWAARPMRVFNIVPAASCTFIVEGVWTHSFSHFRQLRTLVRKILVRSSPREWAMAPGTSPL